jgi:hypothetical protein
MKTRKLAVGGILTIVSGVLGSLGIINYAVGLTDVRGFGRGDIPPFVPSIIYGLPIPALVIAALALVGGVFALRRRHWRWALTGAIAASLSFLLLGIPAIVLIASSKEAFKQ